MNRMSPGFKFFVIGFLLVIAAGITTCAYAATPCANTIACLNWTSPTTFANGTTIPAERHVELICHVWGSLQGTPKRDIALVPCINQTTLLTGLKSGTNCFYIVAEIGGAQSAPSNETCKLIRPAPPTDGSIGAPSNGSIENSKTPR